MGGSSIWFNGFALGIILSVSRDIEEGKNVKVRNVDIDSDDLPKRRKNNLNQELPV